MNPAPRPPTTLVLSWQDIQRDSETLAQALKPRSPWKGIVAVSRGGLAPAAIVARDLKVHLIETVCITSYEGRVKGPVRILKDMEGAIADEGDGWIIIDDIVDTGATALVARRMLPRAHYAVLYVKPLGRPFVDTYVSEVGQEVWISFPWERRTGEPVPSAR